jgi:hypothetical protein
MLREGVSRALVDGGAVLLDERTGRYFHLNSTANLVLDELLSAVAVDDAEERAAARLVDLYGLPMERARKDVRALRSALRDVELVTA